MAKYERQFRGDFEACLAVCEDVIKKSSLSVSFEDASDIVSQQTQVAVRVYERYSVTGGNRTSLNITLVGLGQQLIMSVVITSGGSRGIMSKYNTWGEQNFLKDFVKEFEVQYPQ
ncbi:hypothetical protein RU97_GL001970 [Enterococcus canis]|uniref:Uncharacterized protein n=1 Tax=Enterococcus canis TaxID=214095 RepID=A0A1L8RFS0_9ENTE|nr:DUF6054 family protein [Enterococcus canis]OJG18573.1 hypothetical protein RU97_GL001970 [Enterococcus canis]